MGKQFLLNVTSNTSCNKDDCVFKGNQLPKWAKDSPQKFFSAATRYADANRHSMQNAFCRPFLVATPTLKSPKSIRNLDYSKMLKEADFYRAEYRMVYRVLLELCNAGIEPNILSLSKELRKRQELEKIGLRYVFMLGESA